MRGRSMLVPVAGALALALVLSIRPAGAVMSAASSRLGAARDAMGVVEQVRTVCEKAWDGYEWQSRCRSARPKYSRSAQIRRLQRRLFYYSRHW